MSSEDKRCAEIEEAIAAQKAQRAILGDAVVDTTIRILRKQLETLRALQKTPTVPDSDSEQLLRSIHSHIPPALVDKMLSARHIEGERRQVTVLFADIAGYTEISESLDPEEVASLVQEILKDLAHSVYRYEGYVDKFIGDAVMAVFGAPLAHEDDAERALRAALSMMDRLENFNSRSAAKIGRPLGLHIGINTGPVVAGNVDAELRMPYSVIGDTVNTASRLEGAAESGQILVSRSTWSLARDAFVFEEQESVKVKGKAAPLQVYELKRARLSPEKTRGLKDLADVFVGREEEMLRLRAVADELKKGRGSAVLVTGEAGLGKSRLMAEWRREMEAKGGISWVEGRCYPTTSSIAYGPFLDMIRRASGIDEEQSEEAARRRLDLALGRFSSSDIGSRAVFANLLALCLSGEEQEVLDRMSDKALREQVFHHIEEVFTAHANDGPTVFVFEDLHWADTNSWELIGHLAPLGEGRPLTLVAVSRPITEEPPPLAVVRECCSERFFHLDLSPLSEEGSVEMVTGLLTVDELPAALRELVLGRTEGNPFFMEELVRTLIEKKALAQTENGGWEATHLMGTVTVPDTLKGLLMARLDNLPPDTKWLAQRASVIGRIFLYRVLSRMTKADNRIDDDLGRMERDDLIRKRASAPELEYMFLHALTQEVAYESLLIARRRELHRLVGEAMEELFADRIGEFTSIIGEHFYNGDSWEKAYKYLSRAGYAAARLYANIEGRRNFGRALKCLEHMPETGENQQKRVDTSLKFARIAEFGLPPQEILAQLEKAEDVAQSMPGPDGTPGSDEARLAHVRYRIGRAYYTGGKMREAIGYYKQVLSVATGLKDPELLGIPSFAIGSALVFQGHMGKGRKLLSQGIPALEKLGYRAEWVRAMGMRSFAMTHMGDCPTSQIEAEKALKQAREINSLVAVWSTALMLCGAYSYGFWDVRRTLEAVDVGIKAAEQTGDKILIYMAHGVRAWNLAMFGRFEEADKSMKKCQETAQRIGEQIMCADQFAARSAEIAYGLGWYDEASNLAERAISISQKMGGIWAEGHARRFLGLAIAAFNPSQVNEAESEMDKSLKLMELGQNNMGVSHTRIAWGKICRDRGDLDSARKHWEKAAAFFESKGLAKRLEQVRALIVI